MHGGHVLLPSGAAASATTAMALSFAARYVVDGIAVYQPFLRLAWQGPDATTASATWSALGPDNRPLAPATTLARFAALAQLRDAGPLHFRLVARFESQVTSTLTPSEVAYTGDDGATALIHLPSLAMGSLPAAPNWPLDPALPAATAAVAVAIDGSTVSDGAEAVVRFALDSIAPLTGTRALRRRRVRYRSLCQWDRETATLTYAGTPSGFLDVDPAHGLFALARSDAPPAFPTGPGSPPPSPPAPGSITVRYQDGFSDHIGARPAPREALLQRLQPTPTRLVAGNGALHAGAPSTYYAIARYRTLADALNAIQQAPLVDEVVQFEDSATYPEQLLWPLGPKTMTIQAAEGVRPVIELTAYGGPALSLPPTSPPSLAYQALTLRGLAVTTAPTQSQGQDLHVPLAGAFTLELCTMLRGDDALVLGSDKQTSAVVSRSVCSAIELGGDGKLTIVDSIVDATGAIAPAGTTGPRPALHTTGGGEIDLERVTTIGQTAVQILEASECIFTDVVTVADRFHGCVRFSRVGDPSVLPRRHAVTDAPVRFVSVDRRDPAYARLAADCDPRITRGAEDHSEMGAFHEVQLAPRSEALLRRLREYTPAGLVTGIVRRD
jgi:hypothetical protein